MDWEEPGLPAVLYEYGVYGFFNTTKGFGLYLRDKITIERVTVMLGVRSETQKLYNDLGEEIWSWGLKDFLSPRVSMAIDLLNDGNLGLIEAVFVDESSRPWLDRNTISGNTIGLALYPRDLPFDPVAVTDNGEDLRWLGRQGQVGDK